MRLLLLALLLMIVSGCSTLSRNASAPIEAQKGGYAYGAGGTIQQPVNSAAPSSQISKRDIWYAPPFYVQAPSHLQSPQAQGTVEEPQMLPVVPVREHQEVSTILGEHQDAAGIIKAARMVPMIIWAGIAGLLLGIGGFLHSHNNEPTGYPMVWIITGGIGILLLLFAASGSQSSGWIYLYSIPAALWGMQQPFVKKIIGAL
jgi:hypothetical protein